MCHGDTTCRDNAHVGLPVIIETGHINASHGICNLPNVISEDEPVGSPINESKGETGQRAKTEKDDKIRHYPFSFIS